MNGAMPAGYVGSGKAGRTLPGIIERVIDRVMGTPSLCRPQARAMGAFVSVLVPAVCRQGTAQAGLAALPAGQRRQHYRAPILPRQPPERPDDAPTPQIGDKDARRHCTKRDGFDRQLRPRHG